MSLLMRDSVDARTIPTDTPVVAGYGDGAFIWSPSWWDGSNGFLLFPNATKLVIAVNAADSGDILDVERGDAAPAECPGWADRFNRPGRRAPTIYSDRTTIAAIRQAMGSRPFDWWAATLDGTQTVPGAVAVQYVDTGPYDESVILDPTWLGASFTMVLQPDDLAAIQNMLNAQLTATDSGALIWRVEALLANSPTVAGGPTRGESNGLQAAVAAVPAVDVNALAAALAQHTLTAQLTPAEHQQLALDIAHLFGAKLST